MKTNLKQLTQEEVFRFIENLGQKPYRSRQILNWIYRKYAESFDEMTDLSKGLREQLEEHAYISNLKLIEKQSSKDETQKYLFALEDGKTIESVLIPNTKGKNTYTLCISSQAGCAMDCSFCTTGRLGFKRNLKAHEIADQVISVSRDMAQNTPANVTSGITNIVYMGMGEPFNNFNEVIHSLNKLMKLMGYSKRKITVSTSGIVPKIPAFAEQAPGVNLAISLNATTDETRDSIMPVNRKYPLNKLIRACREFRLAPTRNITFEYVVLGGINDSKEDALRLVSLLKGIKSKVNLIPYNPGNLSAQTGQEDNLKRPSDNKVNAFLKILQSSGVTSTIRKSMGSDISAACGQLKAQYS